MDFRECENGRLPYGVLPHKYYKFVSFTLPEGSFRKAAVDYMRKMAMFEWTPAEPAVRLLISRTGSIVIYLKRE